MTPIFTAICIAFVACMLVCGSFVATKKHHITKSGDVGGVGHKSHKGVVPRVGGVGIYVGVLLASLAYSVQTESYVSLVSVLCLLPAFLTGLMEDFTSSVHPLHRFMGTLLSALLITATTGISISAIGLESIDFLLAIPLVGLLFFAFSFSSMSHAFNLIDGHNGLCGGITVILGFSIVVVALVEGAPFALFVAASVTTANAAFLVFNYPSAQLFMGDNGAYVNGGLLSLAAVSLVETVGTLSPWFAFSLFAYPTYETIYTMYRRIAAGHNFMEPDKLHLHSLLKQSTTQTAPLLWLGCIGYSGLAILFRENATMLILVAASVFYGYSWSYRRLNGKHELKNG